MDNPIIKRGNYSLIKKVYTFSLGNFWVKVPSKSMKHLLEKRFYIYFDTLNKEELLTELCWLKDHEIKLNNFNKSNNFSLENYVNLLKSISDKKELILFFEILKFNLDGFNRLMLTDFSNGYERKKWFEKKILKNYQNEVKNIGIIISNRGLLK